MSGSRRQAISLRSLTVGLLLVLAGVMAEHAIADPVRIGLLAFRPAEQMQAEWEPLRAALAEAVPEREFTLIALDYEELELAVASRRLDFVLTNSGHYVLLLRRHGLSSPLATRVNLTRGVETTVFGGVIIARANDSAIETLGDLAGRRIAYVEKDSLGGFQSQAYELLQVGIRLNDGPRLIETGLPHDRVVEAVLSGQVDAGFLRSGILEALIAEGRLDAASLRIINAQNLPGLPFLLSTRLYPEWPFAALPHIDRDLARRVTTALLSLRDQPEVRAALGGVSFTVPANYAPMEEMLQALELPPFDMRPPISQEDLWREYGLVFGAVSLAFLALLTLAGALVL